MKLIESGQGEAVAFNLGKFSGLSHQEIANKLIELGQGKAVATNLDKFTVLNHQEIAMKLIESGQGEAVAFNLGKFMYFCLFVFNMTPFIIEQLPSAGNPDREIFVYRKRAKKKKRPQ